jgi:hypothetical protein
MVKDVWSSKMSNYFILCILWIATLTVDCRVLSLMAEPPGGSACKLGNPLIVVGNKMLGKEKDGWDKLSDESMYNKYCGTSKKLKGGWKEECVSEYALWVRNQKLELYFKDIFDV